MQCYLTRYRPSRQPAMAELIYHLFSCLVFCLFVYFWFRCSEGERAPPTRSQGRQSREEASLCRATFAHRGLASRFFLIISHQGTRKERFYAGMNACRYIYIYIFGRQDQRASNCLDTSNALYSSLSFFSPFFSLTEELTVFTLFLNLFFG